MNSEERPTRKKTRRILNSSSENENLDELSEEQRNTAAPPHHDLHGRDAQPQQQQHPSHTSSSSHRTTSSHRTSRPSSTGSTLRVSAPRQIGESRRSSPEAGETHSGDLKNKLLKRFHRIIDTSLEAIDFINSHGWLLHMISTEKRRKETRDREAEEKEERRKRKEEEEAEREANCGRWLGKSNAKKDKWDLFETTAVNPPVIEVDEVAKLAEEPPPVSESAAGATELNWTCSTLPQVSSPFQLMHQ
jgi:hypothetical protein